jgi:uncharacterized protein YdaU (DUF1376 family)
MAPKLTKKKEPKPEMSWIRNGQEYEPPYQFWQEPEFQKDQYVNRILTPMQRGMYRAMLQGAFYLSTRPYLPSDDVKLMALADAGSMENWTANKAAIMVLFQPAKWKGEEVWGHKRLIRDWIKLLAYSKKQSTRRKKPDGVDDDFSEDFVQPAEEVENKPNGSVKCDESEL